MDTSDMKGHVAGYNGFLLGSTKLVQAGKTLKLNSRKALGLLAYLAQQGKPIERDVLIELLWSEDDAPGAKGSMRTLLKNLRKHLGEAFYADRQVIALNKDAITWDIDRFSTLAAQEDIAAWVQASALYQGEFMRGFQLDASLEFEDWLETTRHFWFDAVNRVLRNISDYYLHHDQAEKALAYTRRWLELEPWQEKAHRQQMWLHWQLGNFEEALAQYERCATRLEHDLGVEPSLQTFELYELILKDQSKHQWQDIREHAHTQKSTQEPTHKPTPQLPRQPSSHPSAVQPKPTPKAADTATSAPITDTSATRSAPSSSVPTHFERAFRQRYALSSFVGRDREMRTLLEALQHYRLVSVLGLAGVGKSRLAYELIYGVFSDLQSSQRQYQNDNQSDNQGDRRDTTNDVTNSNMLADVRVMDGTTLTAADLERYFAADTTSGVNTAADDVNEAYVLLIDGLTEPCTAVRAVLSEQLAMRPHLRVLVTARYPLNLSGEKQLHLTGLRSAPENASWQDAQKSDAVRLFYERARLQVVGFALDASNTPVIASLCHLVSGLPHALEQLAAWLEVMPVHSLQKHLLEPADPTTLGADWRTTLLDASWQSLDEDQRLRYAACAVLADGFDAEAAHAVTDMTMPQLHTLVKRSLLEVKQGRYALPQVFRPLLLRYLSDGPTLNPANRDSSSYQNSNYQSSSYQTTHLDQLAARHATFYVTCLAFSGALTNADSNNVQRAWHYLCTHLLAHHQARVNTHISNQAAPLPDPPHCNEGNDCNDCNDCEHFCEHLYIDRYLPLLVTYYWHYGSLHTLLNLLEHTWQAVHALPATALQVHTLAYLSRITLQCGNSQQAHDYLEQAHARSSLSSVAIASLEPGTSTPNTSSTSLDASTPTNPSTATIIPNEPLNNTPDESTNEPTTNPASSQLEQATIEAMNVVLLSSGIYALFTDDNDGDSDSDTAKAHFRGLLEQPNYQLLARYHLACLALQQGDVTTAQQWQRALEARATIRTTRNPTHHPHAERHQNTHECATEYTSEYTSEPAHRDGVGEEDNLTVKRWLLAMRLELATGRLSNAQRHFARLRNVAERSAWRDVAFQVAFYGASLHEDPFAALEQAFDIAHARADHLGALAAANAWLWCAYETSTPMPRRCEVQSYVVNMLEHPDTLPTTSLLTALLALAALNLNNNSETATMLAAHVAAHPTTPVEVRQQALRYLEADVPDTPKADVLTLLPAALDNLTPCV